MDTPARPESTPPAARRCRASREYRMLTWEPPVELKCPVAEGPAHHAASPGSTGSAFTETAIPSRPGSRQDPFPGQAVDQYAATRHDGRRSQDQPIRVPVDV